MKKGLILFFACGFTFSSLHAQDDLIKKVNTHQTQQATGFQFKDHLNLTYTPVENQGSSGTCWSYAANSFLESEMIKKGKQPIYLSKIFTARNTYLEKAENYLRMDGFLNYGDGGQAHDVTDMYAKYGTMPYDAYTGLVNGATKNNFNHMQNSIEGMLKNWVATTTPLNWKQQVSDTLDTYLGKVPTTFTYEGKDYSPETFTKNFVGLKADDYIEIISQTNTPFWEKTMLMVPDNWAFRTNYYNVPMQEFTSIIDRALEKGYTIAWDTDVSEPYFSWVNGVAIVPENAASLTKESINKELVKSWFDAPKAEMNVTQELRQQAYEDKRTTDDHLMHIVGKAKDQNGKDYYIVKNSWGDTNAYDGFLYVSKAFVDYKTIALMVNKNALTKSLRKKMKI